MVKYLQNKAGLVGPPIKKPKKRKKYRKRNQPKRKAWKKKELINLLRIKAMSLGHSPTKSDMDKDPDMPSLSVYVARWGTWNAALLAADLAPRNSSTSLTPIEKEQRWADKREELLALYLEKWETLGHLPLCSEIDADPNMPSSTTFRKYFGNFGAVVKMLGESPTIIHRRRADDIEYTDEYLCQALRKKWYQIGRTPTWRDVGADYNMPSTKVYLTRWGTWTKSLKAAKIPLNQNNVNIARNYTDEELLQILRDLYQELGRAPVEQDLNFSSFLPTASTYLRRFGGFATAKRLSGIPDPDATTKTKVRLREKSPKWSKEKVAEALFTKSRALGRMPSWNEVNRDSTMPCMTTVRKHFANADAAVRYYLELYPWRNTSSANTSFSS